LNQSCQTGKTGVGRGVQAGAKKKIFGGCFSSLAPTFDRKNESTPGSISSGKNGEGGGKFLGRWGEVWEASLPKEGASWEGELTAARLKTKGGALKSRLKKKGG